MKQFPSDKLAGLLYGSAIGDALALGAHWIYDQEEIRREFGRVTEFLDPRADSYHPGKKRGAQTHYGDQLITLMASIEAAGGFTPERFSRDWQRMWTGYSDYFDHATKETLENLAQGSPPEKAASESNELGGAARIAPLLVWMSREPLEQVIAAARAQTAITHGAPIVGDAAEWLTRVVFALLAGAGLREAIEEAAKGDYQALDLQEIGQRVEATKALGIAAAAKELGLACPAPKAIPTLLMLIERCGDDFETAMIENVTAGGDNAARGLALGLVLGARHGVAAIPERWRNSLKAGPRIDAFLQAAAKRP